MDRKNNSRGLSIQVIFSIVTLLLFVTLAIVSSNANAASKSRQMVPIAHYQNNDFNIPKSLLEEMRNAGYKYVILQGSLSSPNVTEKDDWGKGNPDGTYDPVTKPGLLYKTLKEEFIKAAEHGLQLIPRFQIGNSHSDWKVTNNAINPDSPNITESELSDLNFINEYEYELLPAAGNDDLGGSNFIEILPVDIDGDGKTEIMQLWDNSGRLGLEVYSIRGDPADPTKDAWYHPFWSNIWTNLDLGGVDAIKFLTGDVNDDGKTDLLQLWDNNGRLGLEVYTSDGTGYRLAWSNTWTGVDLGGVGAIKFLTADVNDDQRTDLLQLWDNNGRLGLEVYTSDGTGYRLAWSNTWTGLDLGGSNFIEFLTASVNDDEFTDILQLWDNNGRLGLEVYTSDGTGYRLAWSNTWTGLDLGGAEALDFLTADVNGDGRTDILQLWDNNGRLGLEIYTSDGTGYLLAWSNTWHGFNLGGAGGAIKFLTADVNGDAYPELLHLWKNEDNKLNPRLGLAINLGGKKSIYTPEWGEGDLGGAENKAGSQYIDFLTGNTDADSKTEFLQVWDNSGRLAVNVYNSLIKNTLKLPPFAECVPVPCGLDLSFKSYLDVVRRAFDDAKRDYPHLNFGDHLDYIDLGHDEMVTGSSLDIVIATTSELDQDYIKEYIRNNGDNANDDAYYALVADEIVRRVDAVNETFDGKTKALISADAFDPEHNGGRDFYGWTDLGGPRSVKLNTKEVLKQEALQSVKDNIILVPWQYDTKFEGKDYKADETLRYFKKPIDGDTDYGFKVITASAYDDICKKDASWDDGNLKLIDQRDMLVNWVEASELPEFEDTVIGFVAYIWYDPVWDETKAIKEQGERFYVIPELAKRAGFFLLNDLVTFNVNQEVSVTVENYVLERTLGIFGDPFVVVNINGVGEQHTDTAENIRQGRTVVPRPNVFSRSVDPATINNSIVPVVLKMRDDDGIRGPSGADELIDINPKGGLPESDLVTLYNTKTNAVAPQSPQRGDDSNSRAKINYRVESRRSGVYTPQTSGCPSSFSFDGTFGFDTTLTNISSDVLLKDVKVTVSTLTPRNILLVDDGHVGEQEGFDVYSEADESLKPTYSETIPFTVCLERRNPFDLYVDVVGKADPWTLTVQGSSCPNKP